jgi:hypothetical protein
MRNRALYTGLKLLFTPEALLPFLIGSVALAVLGNGVYQLLTNWLGTTTFALVEITVSALFVLLFIAWILSHIINRLRPLPELIGIKHPTKRRGLILLVSREEPCRKAIEWHAKRLEYCWLFYSERTAQIAHELEDELRRRGKRVVTEYLDEVFNPLQIKKKVEEIYMDLPAGFTESDVILDFTGMTAVVSVGAVLACINRPRAIQYVPALFDDAIHAMRSYDPVEVVFLENQQEAIKEGEAS